MEKTATKSPVSVQASPLNEGLKNFIIGKLWVNSINSSRPGAIRINRNLPTEIVLKAGTTLFLSINKKREGKQDADFSVSVLLPTATAETLIAASQKLAAEIAEAPIENDQV